MIAGGRAVAASTVDTTLARIDTTLVSNAYYISISHARTLTCNDVYSHVIMLATLSMSLQVYCRNISGRMPSLLTVTRGAIAVKQF